MPNRDLLHLSDAHREAIFEGRRIGQLARSNEGVLEIIWDLSESPPELSIGTDRRRPIEVTALPEGDRIGYTIHKTTGSVYVHAVLNSDHPFVRWVVAVWRHSLTGDSFVDSDRFNTLLTLLRTPVEHSGHELPRLHGYVEQWRGICGLPPDLCPPELTLSQEMFSHPWQSADKRP